MFRRLTPNLKGSMRAVRPQVAVFCQVSIPALTKSPRCFHSQTKLHASANQTGLKKEENVGNKRFSDFDLAGRVFVVTGGARGLGLSLAEGLVEAGGKEYRQQNVNDTASLDQLIADIADENQQLNGVIAAAGIQQVTPAAECTADDANRIMATNYTAVFMTASAATRMMFKYQCHGSICLIASMSGLVANKGLLSPAYNASKAAVIQLARSLAMEWSPAQKDGTGGIRVNSLSPGYIRTPMVSKIFEEAPELRETWTKGNMLGRLAETSEFKGAALFLMSNASSFVTGSDIVVDGGHTAW